MEIKCCGEKVETFMWNMLMWLICFVCFLMHIIYMCILHAYIFDVTMVKELVIIPC